VELVKEAIAALDMTKAKDVLKDFTARGGKLASIDDVVTSVPAA
jgi:hypothetical protein